MYYILTGEQIDRQQQTDQFTDNITIYMTEVFYIRQPMEGRVLVGNKLIV